SSGQDMRFSTLTQGFNSPMRYQLSLSFADYKAKIEYGNQSKDGSAGILPALNALRVQKVSN
ncbi:MAG: hypothetical protein ACR2GD_01945, partial [Pyrinomonadaceae bacterium]